MKRLIVDGKIVKAEEGLNLLEVIDEVDLQIHEKKRIPRLCYNEALEPYGACRLCVVEVKKQDKTKVETACTYQVESGIIVKSQSPRVLKSRQTTLELLLAKAPESEVIKDLAFRHGVTKQERFESRGDNFLENCIDCGLCTRACEEIVGKSAIVLAGRGDKKRISTAYDSDSDDCIGCGTCAYICPTNAIKIEDYGNKRKIWGKEFELTKEKQSKFTQEQMNYLKNMKKTKDTPFYVEVHQDLCKNCERCIVECPQYLFSNADSFNEIGYKPASWGSPETNKLSCVGCGVCYDVCPESAIDIYMKRKNVQIVGDAE